MNTDVFISSCCEAPILNPDYQGHGHCKYCGDTTTPAVVVKTKDHYLTEYAVALRDSVEGVSRWIAECLYRHHHGDWGDTLPKYKEVNNKFLDESEPGPIASYFSFPEWIPLEVEEDENKRFIIIVTDAKREHTCIIHISETIEE